MSNQTAVVEWLWNQIKSNNINSYHEIVDLFNQAKQMEREQIQEAFQEGLYEGVYRMVHKDKRLTFEQYHKHTYGGDNE